MNRRDLLVGMPVLAAGLAVGCVENRLPRDGTVIMTVRGRIRARDLGVTLTHEHLLANFQPYADWLAKPAPYDRAEVVRVALPHLQRIRALGCQSFVDATAVGLGRDVRLLRELSLASGMNIVTVTGNYAAFDQKFLPPHVASDTPVQLAARWIREWREGIDGTDIRPGFIKLGFNGGPLNAAEQNLIRAAAIAHRETGLPIGAHTGPAVAAFEQLAILDAEGVRPSAWIWIHAQNEPDVARHIEAAKRGAWISFDGVSADSAQDHAYRVSRLRDAGLLHRVLISQDAGWYWVGEPGGGKFRPFDLLFTEFLPALRSRGFTTADVDQLLITNPAAAFSIGL